MNKDRLSVLFGIIIIWSSHFILDFMLGVWSVYKTLATINLVLAGVIASVGMLIGEGLQLYFGLLSDRGHHKKLMTLGLGLTLTIPFLPYIEKEWILFIFILSSYIGSGAFHPASSSLLVSWTTSSKSLFIALFASGGTVGAGISHFAFTHIYLNYEGQTWILAVPIVILTLFCLIFPFSKTQTLAQKQEISFRKTWQGLAPYRRELVTLYIIQVCLQTIVIAFTFLLPDILKMRGYSNGLCLGGGYFCFIAGATLTSIPIGYCIDKWGYRPILGGIILISMILLCVFLTAPDLSLMNVAILLILIGGSMGIIVPVMVAGGNSIAPPQASGFISALYMGGASCLAGFGPMIACLIATYFDEQAPVRALQCMGLLFAIPIGLFYFLPQASEQAAAEEVIG